MTAALLLSISTLIGNPYVSTPESRVCGPQAVRAVLSIYGDSPLLYDLIKEIQPNGELPTMFQLKNSLETRGVNVHPVCAKKGSVLTWHSPAIVHLKSGESPGHFVVWIPSPNNPEIVRYWSGGELHEAAKSAFSAEMTGPVLLTSKEPIVDSRGSLRIPLIKQPPYRQALIGIVMIVGAVLSIRRFVKKNGSVLLRSKS